MTMFQNGFMDFIDAVLSQLVGFFLWVLVTPLRLIIGVLDPVFSPMTALLDIDSFLDGIEVLRPFFRDVNYFIPIGAALGVFGATVLFAFLWCCFCYTVLFNVKGFGNFTLSILAHVVIDAVDHIKVLVRGVIAYFFH